MTRRLPAYLVIGEKGKYLIFKDNAAGKRGRYSVVKLNVARPVYVGLELPLGHARKVCR